MYARRHVSTANRHRVEPTFPPRPHRWRTVVAALAAAGAVFAGAYHADAGEYRRPQITISASAQGLAVPSEVPGGLVDITLETEADEAAGAENVGHHLVIARLNDGVTLEEAMAAGDAAFTTMMTVKGGNGTIAAGESLEMTLDLQPGNYFVLDNPQLPDPVIETFVVVEPTGVATRAGGRTWATAWSSHSRWWAESDASAIWGRFVSDADKDLPQMSA